MKSMMSTPWRVGLLAALGVSGGAVAAGPQAPDSAARLFQTNTVWNLRLSFTPEQWAAIEPAAPANAPGDPGGGPGGPRGPGLSMFLAPAMMKGDVDRSGTLSREEVRTLATDWFTRWDMAQRGALDVAQVGAGLGSLGDMASMMESGREDRKGGLSAMMGLEFPSVHAALDLEGQRLEDIAARYKGNFTYLQSRNQLKRSLKLDLDRFVKGQRLADEDTLNLHSNVTDAGWMNEVLSYQLYRDAGVPASRTSYAWVTLTVPGRYDQQAVGLYSLVEDVNKDFARARFGTPEGALFKPTTASLFTDLGDDWKAYARVYDPKGKPTSEQAARLIAFCKFVSHASDEEFAAKLGQYLDVEAFARYMAVTVQLSTLDSPLVMGQNFYVYLHPKTNRFSVIPWDLDHSFGQFPMVGNAAQEELSLDKPWQGDKRFLARVFGVAQFQKLYRARLREFHQGLFQPERLARQVDALARVLRPFVERESADKLARFDRVIAGESIDPLPMNFGPPPGGASPGGPPPGGPPGGGPPMFGKVRPLKAFARARYHSVEEQLAGRSQGTSLDRPGGPGGGFDPARFVAPRLVGALDANKDGEVSREEFVQGFTGWFDAWSSPGGTLTREQLSDGLNKTLGGPPPPPAPKP